MVLVVVVRVTNVALGLTHEHVFDQFAVVVRTVLAAGGGGADLRMSGQVEDGREQTLFCGWREVIRKLFI